MAAQVGDNNYGRLGIMTQYFVRLSIYLMWGLNVFARCQKWNPPLCA